MKYLEIWHPFRSDFFQDVRMNLRITYGQKITMNIRNGDKEEPEKGGARLKLSLVQGKTLSCFGFCKGFYDPIFYRDHNKPLKIIIRIPILQPLQWKVRPFFAWLI